MIPEHINPEDLKIMTCRDLLGIKYSKGQAAAISVMMGVGLMTYGLLFFLGTIGALTFHIATWLGGNVTI
jgi:hypothetical protein